MITVVTLNKGKATEIAAFFTGITKIDSVPLDLVEPQAETLEEIAQVKAKQAYAELKRPLIVDDTGLFIEELNGFPGPYAAYVQGTVGNAGILALMKGKENRTAYFRTVIAYADENGIQCFSGSVAGVIADAPRGCSGFGYDSVFEVGNRTLAEMEMAEKNAVSHRARALAVFRAWYTGQHNG